ncbi:MAG: MFS transporter [Actinomycetota bacterium]|nr:MFS transporter [Actinomycetota bacterium]
MNRHFVRLWLGQSVSQLGDAVVEVTLPVWVGMLTGSPGHVAGVAAAEILPSLLAGPFAGALADRLDARRAMIACDLVRAALVLSLLLAPVSFLVPCVYAVGFLVALVGLLFNPAKNVAVRSVVGPAEIGRALALSRTTESAALVLGPALGSAVLLAFGPAAGLVFDALTFLAGAGGVASAQVPRPRPLTGDVGVASPARQLVSEVGEGLRVVRADADLLAALAAGSVVYLVGHVWFSVDVFFVEDSLGAPKESVGALWAASGAGGLLGGLVALAAERSWSWKAVLPAGLAVDGAATVWYALSGDYAWAMAAACASGLGGSLVAVAVGSAMMLRSPPAVLGRVSALFEAAGQLAALVALLLLGLLGGLASPSRILLACGLLVLVCCLGTALRHARTRGRG